MLEFWRLGLSLDPPPNDLIKLRDYRSYRSPCTSLKAGNNLYVSATKVSLQSMDNDIRRTRTVQLRRAGPWRLIRSGG